MTTTPDFIAPDVPPHDPEQDGPDPDEKPTGKPERKPHDPIKRLWRYSKSDRRRMLDPFIGRMIWVDRWHGRVAANGDTQYEGKLVTVALSTLGSAADLLIIQTTGRMVWAVSAAQVAELKLAREGRR